MCLYIIFVSLLEYFISRNPVGNNCVMPSNDKFYVIKACARKRLRWYLVNMISNLYYDSLNSLKREWESIFRRRRIIAEYREFIFYKCFTISQPS